MYFDNIEMLFFFIQNFRYSVFCGFKFVKGLFYKFLKLKYGDDFFFLFNIFGVIFYCYQFDSYYINES